MSKLRRFLEIRAELGSEAGQTLILALVVLLVLTISAGAVAQLMTSNQNLSNNERQGVQAFSGGEAGLDVAANWVVAHDGGSVLPVNTTQSATTTVAGNAVTWTATKLSTDHWKVGSTTHSPNGKVTRVLQEQLNQQIGQSNFWDYGLVLGGQSNPSGHTPYDICENGTGPDQPTVFGGSGTVNVPFWTAGDVCTSGGDSPLRNPTSGTPITVHIGGFIYGSNGPSYLVGAPGNNVANFEAIGGCYDKHTNSGQLPLACDRGGNATSGGGNSGIFSSAWAASPEPVTPPTLSASDESGLYSTASPGPNHPCDGTLSAGTWPAHLFDSSGSSVADSSLGTQNLLTALGTNAFVCRTSSGSIAWSPPASRGARACLHVTGKVFLDGSYTMGSSDKLEIDTDGTNACGNGTAANPNTYPDGPSAGSIYVDGTLTMTRNASICSAADFDASFNCTIPDSTAAVPATIPEVFWSFFNRNSTIPAFSMEGSSRFESSAFMNGKYFLTNGTSSSSVGGSIFATYAEITGGTSFSVTQHPPPDSIEVPTISWQVAPRTWRQCPVTGCS